MNKKSGIYQIRNIFNGKLYIGQSIDLHKRKLAHFSNLKNNDGRTNSHLQNSYNKYGKENFIFEALLYCEEFQLTDYEQFFVDKYKDFGLLYNARLKCVDSSKGVVVSEEARKNMSESTKGEKNSQWGKKGKDSPSYGRRHTEEELKKMSENHYDCGGKNNPSYGKRGKDSLNYGRKHTEESKRQMSEAAKNRPPVTDEARKNMSKAKSGKNHPMYGKHRKEETKRKMSESKKGKNHPRIIREDVVLETLKLLKKEMKVKEISKKLNISCKTVYKAKNGGYDETYDLNK